MLRSRPHVESLEARDLLSRYIVTDLGDFAPRAINQYGVIAGTVNGEPSVWEHGVIRDLGIPDGYILAAPQAINDAGVVVGNGIAADFTAHALYWDQWGAIDLGGIGTPSISATGINDASTVVGWSSDPAGNGAHPVMWPPHRGAIDLEPNGGTTADFAYGVNDAGQITGDYHSRAYRWQDGVFYSLGSDVAYPTHGQAINSRGDVAGYWYNGSSPVPALWTGDVFTNLGLLPGQFTGRADAINDAGDVVGDDGNGAPTSRGFLWHVGALTDLNALVHIPGYHVTGGFGINNAGQILVGARPDSGGAGHPFLLTPRLDLAPELGWALMLVQHHSP